MDKLSKSVNSHIQMPKLIMKRFVNSTRKFYYYDVEKKVLCNNGSPRKINTEINYFDADTEEFLDKYVENPLADLLNRIKNLNMDESNVGVYEDTDVIGKRYLYSLISRDKLSVKEIRENSVYSQFFSDEILRNFAARQEIIIAERNNLLSDYIVTYCINRTDIPFVLPTCGVYSFMINGKHYVNMPINSDFALFMVKTDEWLDGIPAMEILNDNEQLVHQMNEKAFQKQVENGSGFIISQYKEELERLVETY